MKSFLVIGLGRFGAGLALSLSAQGQEVMVMDTSSDKVQKISSEVTHAVVADARDIEVLKAIGVRNFDCCVVAIGDSLEASVLITMNLRELGAEYIICKAHNDMYRKVLEKLGVDRVIIPEQEQASRLAKSLCSQRMLEFIELSEEYAIVEIPAPSVWNGKTIIELNLRKKYGINVIAVGRKGHTEISPGGGFTILDGDVLMVLGDNKALKAVQKL